MFEFLEYLANGCSFFEIMGEFTERLPLRPRTTNLPPVMEKGLVGFPQGPQAEPPRDLATALRSYVTQSNFAVIEGEGELRRILDEPLEKWRFFLHPQQRRLALRDYSGPSRVLGGAGTGKTVVALHRAKWLASKCAGQERILFTTFTKNLATDIKHKLKKICTHEEYAHIDVYNLDLWINEFMESQKYDFKIAYGEEISKLWDEAIALNPNADDYGKTFYREEWAQIVIPQEAFSLDEYHNASRAGRGTGLNPKEKENIWGVFKTLINLMDENKLRDINMATYECRKIIENMNSSPLYSSVIVDEGEDFNENDYKLIRKIAGNEHLNDLFIVGDAHQRIYNQKTVLSRCGINLAGRGGYLRLNYRTTEEIRKRTVNILKDEPIDDLNGGRDKEKQCQSLTHGKPPVIKLFNDFDQELAFIVGEIKNLPLAGDDLRNVCLVARTDDLLENYKTELMKRGFPVHHIQLEGSDDQTKKGIRLTTMHGVKGLEFPYLFMAAVNDGIIPPAKPTPNADKVTERERLTSEKRLLYVAMTRAQKALYLTGFGQGSELLQAFD
ncbi:MAG: UvrD-helicase domain-containing protein [Deltaproteobacteria bacterium]|nr:UvrD-helicase domain-containing protein [Deltaproteobacteria bacterium]